MCVIFYANMPFKRFKIMWISLSIKILFVAIAKVGASVTVIASDLSEFFRDVVIKHVSSTQLKILVRQCFYVFSKKWSRNWGFRHLSFSTLTNYFLSISSRCARR